MWSRMWRASMARRPPSCPSRCLGTTARECTPIRAFGNGGNHCLPAMDKNLYELPTEEHAKIPQVPGSLGEALDYLEKDHEYLLKGDVFTRDFLEMWLSHKRKEHDALRLRPHPYEFYLYYDV